MLPTSKRLLNVFPPGFDGKPASSQSHYHFSAALLYQQLVNEYSPHSHIDYTLVKSAWYGKQKKSIRREFILIEVEDTVAKLNNYMVIDCDPGEHRAPRRLQLSSTSGSLRGGALGTFRVSYDGVETQLLRECQLFPRKYLEKIDFIPHNALYLYQLVTLVHIISEKGLHCPITHQNGYWFTGLIWECLRSLHPRSLYNDRLSNKRGKIGVLRIIPDVCEKEAACDAFKREMESIETRFSTMRNIWAQSKDIADRAELSISTKLSDPELELPWKSER